MIEKRYVVRSAPLVRGGGGEDEMRSRYIRVVGATSIVCTRNRRCMQRPHRMEKRNKYFRDVFLGTGPRHDILYVTYDISRKRQINGDETYRCREGGEKWDETTNFFNYVRNFSGR